MKLIDALEIMKQPIADDATEVKVCLACGFTPLHLQPFLTAELRTRFPGQKVRVSTGLFGDLIGNIERLDPSRIDALVLIIEWSDLDPRLSVRRLGGWAQTDLDDIIHTAESAAARLRQIIARVAEAVPTVVSMPTLPLPPMFWTPPDLAGTQELHLRQVVAALAVSLSQVPGVRIVNTQRLTEASPEAQRFDVKSEVITGFPYSLTHASALAGLLANLIATRATKKGLITDLDDTFWGGILGEDGVHGVSWDAEHKTHMHGVYQQFLASLSSAGVLLGVASKNDPALVEQALDRRDLLISKQAIFPVEAHWSSKSQSIKRILETWNVDADSVVFVDDSPMELAEVKAAFPQVTCLLFPRGDYQGTWSLLKQLRGLFGKTTLTAEDSLRVGSIRNASAWRDSYSSSANASDEFLKAADAFISFDLTSRSEDVRAFELVNKTNQFNLNGRRLSQSEWLNFFSRPTAFLLTVSYEDKYGPLGKIAALMGTKEDSIVRVSSWVMSCRAFSRRVEHQCLRYLFEDLGAATILFDYQSTPRNGPLQDSLAELLECTPAGEVRLSREVFFGNSPSLFHRIAAVAHV